MVMKNQTAGNDGKTGLLRHFAPRNDEYAVSVIARNEAIQYIDYHRIVK